MKKSFVWTTLIVLLSSMNIGFATTVNDELVDEIDQLEGQERQEQMEDLQDNLEFESFSSCEDMQTVLEDFLEKHKDSFGGRGGWYGGMAVDEDMVMMDAEESADDGGDAMPVPAPSMEASKAQGATNSSSVDVSTTNIQVEGVDEPDILKTDGEYIYYYNQSERQISVLSSPLDLEEATIDLDALQVESTITIPSSFQQVQLFLKDDKLVILGQRWRDQGYNQYLLDRSSKVNVVVYDMSDVTDPVLDRLSDLDGYYSDARLIGDQLYVVSQLSVNRWGRIWEYMEEGEDLPVQDLLPTSFEVSKTDNTQKQNLKIAGKTYPYAVARQTVDCDDVLYVLPTDESVNNLNSMPTFTVVRSIDIDTSDNELQTTTMFGGSDTIHMSEDTLYVAGSIYFSQRTSCPANARCIMPWFPQGTSTLLHRFTLNRGDLTYDASNVVMGQPLSQYSMSEDADGNFRLLTKVWSPQVATHFFVLDEDLDVVGMLNDIEPGEEFKSSRYIGDKLYLVTFEQTDPLFVIDLEDIEDPKIIGELKIPGFSTYLHPYASEEDGKQYLLGLGYDTKVNQRGGVVTNGLKVDLYEIDYNDVSDDDMVAVSQLYTETYGEGQSYSEALENPRMFVRDPARNLLVLPMVLQDEEAGQTCSVEFNASGEEIYRNCYETTRQKTTFAGMKGITVSVADGIEEEFSYDYQDRLRNNNAKFMEGDDEMREEMQDIYPWQFRQLQFRVGYLGDAMYAINNSFAHMVIPGTDPLEEVYVDFVE